MLRRLSDVFEDTMRQGPKNKCLGGDLEVD